MIRSNQKNQRSRQKSKNFSHSNFRIKISVKRICMLGSNLTPRANTDSRSFICSSLLSFVCSLADTSAAKRKQFKWQLDRAMLVCDLRNYKFCVKITNNNISIFQFKNCIMEFGIACDNCHQEFDLKAKIPLLLPQCGCTVCKECAQIIQSKNQNSIRLTNLWFFYHNCLINKPFCYRRQLL